MDLVDCLFKALGIGYVLWMVSFLFLPPKPAVPSAKAERAWWMDYQHEDSDSDTRELASSLERRN